MSCGDIVRNLRDGQLTITDAASASLTLVLDNGDLEFSLPQKEAIEIKDRGALCQVRDGDSMSIPISYSLKWQYLIGDTVTGSSDGTMFLEFIVNRHDTYASVLPPGQKFALQHQFLVTDPANGASTDEQITFAKVYKEDVRLGEGDQFNQITFSGRDFEELPDIQRV